MNFQYRWTSFQFDSITFAQSLELWNFNPLIFQGFRLMPDAIMKWHKSKQHLFYFNSTIISHHHYILFLNRVDCTEKLRIKLESLRALLDEPPTFKKIYRYAFDFARVSYEMTEGWFIFMPPNRRCRRHYVFGLSVRPDVRPDYFVYAITQVLLDGISSNLVRRSSWMWQLTD